MQRLTVIRSGTCAIALATTMAAAGCAVADPPANPPNILFIYIDDMGWRDLGVMGSEYYETPNVNRLASEGMLFTNAYANAPNCAPSRAALMSGQYAPRTGVYTVGSAARGQAQDRRLVPVENRTDLDLGVVTLAESLQAAGYATGHVGKWHLGGDGQSPSDQGFDWAVAGDAGGSPPGYFYPWLRGGETPLPGLETGTEGEYLADRLTDEAIGFITTPRDQPFFLYMSHYSVHTPLQGKPDLVEYYRGKPGSNGHDDPRYGAMVHSADESVGRLLATLDESGLAENTIVIFTSDNGGFGPATSMVPLRGSKGMLYEGGIRVPLIVRWPGQTMPGVVSAVPTIGTDFYPTLLEIARASPPDGQILDGTNLLPAWEGTLESLPRPLFWHFPAYLERDASVERGIPFRTTPASAVRVGQYKLIYFFEDSRAELYDLDADISESKDLSSEMPGKTAELQALLRAWWAETDAFLPSARTSR